MKVAVDGRSADVARGTGIGTYTRSLLRAISRAERRNEYLVAWPRGESFDLTRSQRFRCVPLSGHPRPEEDREWLAASPAQVYHLPQNGFNVPPMPDYMGLVVTVHDLIPFLLPEMVRPGYLHKFIIQVPRAVTLADRVIAVSECTARALVTVLNVPRERIVTIPNAPPRSLRPLPVEECQAVVARRYGLTEPYLLHVGGTNPRKNLQALFLAYARVRRRLTGSPVLAIAGSVEADSPLALLVRALGLDDDVRFLGFVPEYVLPHLYGASGLFIYPSLYEGFGIPPLEAMACGVPVVTANTSALPEVVGDAALTVDPEDAMALAEAIRRGWEDDSLRTGLRLRGFARAAMFTWERSARETLRVYSIAANARTQA